MKTKWFWVILALVVIGVVVVIVAEEIKTATVFDSIGATLENFARDEGIALLEPNNAQNGIPDDLRAVADQLLNGIKPSQPWGDFGEKAPKVNNAPVFVQCGPKSVGTIEGWYIVPQKVTLIADVQKSDVPTDSVVFVLGTPFTDDATEFKAAREPKGDTATTERWTYEFDSGTGVVEIAGFAIAANKFGEGWSGDFAMIHGNILK